MPMASKLCRIGGIGRLANRLNHEFAPSFAPATVSGMARMNDAARKNPKSSDQKTECSMPRGTVCRALSVSSDVWAEASKPVIV
jgi:hypothetical protein